MNEEPDVSDAFYEGLLDGAIDAWPGYIIFGVLFAVVISLRLAEHRLLKSRRSRRLPRRPL